VVCVPEKCESSKPKENIWPSSYIGKEYIYITYIKISFEDTNIKSCLRDYINIYKSPLRATQNLMTELHYWRSSVQGHWCINYATKMSATAKHFLQLPSHFCDSSLPLSVLSTMFFKVLISQLHTVGIICTYIHYPREVKSPPYSWLIVLGFMHHKPFVIAHHTGRPCCLCTKIVFQDTDSVLQRSTVLFLVICRPSSLC